VILIALEERRWLLRNLALGLVEYLGVAEPPVPVEALLRHPPSVLESDLGIVEMYSNLWDATFARLTDLRGSIFVRIGLPSHERRFALARELLRALVTSEHGRAMGLPDNSWHRKRWSRPIGSAAGIGLCSGRHSTCRRRSRRRAGRTPRS
jgi:hypothetical protein